MDIETDQICPLALKTEPMGIGFPLMQNLHRAKNEKRPWQTYSRSEASVIHYLGNPGRVIVGKSDGGLPARSEPNAMFPASPFSGRA